MHWLKTAATRAGLPAADQLAISRGFPAATAWDTAARTLGLSPRDLAARLAPALGVRPANLEGAEPRALKLLPERLARRYVVYPLREDDRTITVATSDPTDLDTEQAIGFAAGRRAIFELAPPHAITEAINSGYSPDRAVEKLLSSVDDHIADAVRVVEDSGPETIDEPNPAGPRVLVVDDDAVLRMLASTVLRKAGYFVETSDDGALALERLSRGEEFSLIVTDLHMPNLSGGDLLKAVRESTVNSGVPVIVFTGSDQNTEEARLMDAGADDYIRKPINPERFVSRVRAALRRASL